MTADSVDYDAAIHALANHEHAQLTLDLPSTA